MNWLSNFSPFMAKIWEAIAGLPGPLPSLVIVVLIFITLFVVSCFTRTMSGRRLV